MNNHREVWDEHNFKALRNSNLRREDFAETNGKWDTVVFVVSVVIGVSVLCGVGFLGWLK